MMDIISTKFREMEKNAEANSIFGACVESTLDSNFGKDGSNCREDLLVARENLDHKTWRAFEDNPEQKRMCAAADYNDEWTFTKDGAFKTFYCCGGRTQSKLINAVWLATKCGCIIP